MTDAPDTPDTPDPIAPRDAAYWAKGVSKLQLGEVPAEAAALGPGAIVLNFEGVDYINSTGIALIVGLLARARAERRTVGACGLTDHYREIFEITRLSDFMGIYADEDSAAGAPAAAGNTGRQP